MGVNRGCVDSCLSLGPRVPEDYTCTLYPTTGTLSTSGTSCQCPNSADPCTYSEARLTASEWQDQTRAGDVVTLAENVVYMSVGGAAKRFTVTDAHLSLCSRNPNHFVLCKGKSVTAVQTVRVPRVYVQVMFQWFSDDGLLGKPGS